MTPRNRHYGPPRVCEYDGCERLRGASVKSELTHGCVLCTRHENEYQLGNITLPDSATELRKRKAANKILG